MFGPDLCGYDVSRIHAIFTDKAGKNLLKRDEVKLEYADKDEYTHVYTLIVKADHSYSILFDGKERASGAIADDWDFPRKTIDDPSDSKPSDWVDEKEIDDPSDTKPADWDTPKLIPDPNSAKPEEWDEEVRSERSIVATPTVAREVDVADPAANNATPVPITTPQCSHCHIS